MLVYGYFFQGSKDTEPQPRDPICQSVAARWESCPMKTDRKLELRWSTYKHPHVPDLGLGNVRNCFVSE